MVIGVDVDEVLRKFVLQLQIMYNTDFPNDWTKQVTEYDIAPFFQLGGDIYHYFDVSRAREIYTMASEFEGAKEFVELLMKDHEVWIVSKQKHGNEAFTLEWLKRMEIPYHSIAFTANKHKIELDILIEDSAKNLENARMNGILGIAMDRPWNQSWDGARAKDFAECLSIIRGIADRQDVPWFWRDK